MKHEDFPRQNCMFTAPEAHTHTVYSAYIIQLHVLAYNQQIRQ